MIWLALAVAAFGGGVLATLLDTWISHVRAYEIARLQVLNDLDSINAVSETLREIELTEAEHERVRYPTQTWSADRALMVTRLHKCDPELLSNLSSIFAALEHEPFATALEDPIKADLKRAYEGLTKAKAGVVASALVYGPRYALRARST